jgi:parallel beta-helix repeat protein
MTVYYVSSVFGSNENAGTSAAAPLATLQAAADLTAPGDVVEVMNGTYSNPSGNGGALVTITTSGTAAAPITFEAMPGQTPIIDSSGNWSGIAIVGASYIDVQGFDIVGDAQNITLAYAQSQDTNLNNPLTSGDGIDVEQASPTGAIPSHIIIQNNIVHSEPGAGIDAMNADYVSVLNNTVYNNANWSPYAASGISVGYSKSIHSTTGIHDYIIGNTVYDNQELVVNYVNGTGTITDGNGIIIDSDKATGYLAGTVISDNLSYDNGGSGIQAFDSASVTISNNTAYQNDQSGIGDSQIDSEESTNVTITNNATPPTPVKQTPSQTWVEKHALSLTLPTGAFVDPQGEALTYSATLANGAALPSWLVFKASAGTFSGTAPATPQTIAIKVTATDTAGMSASETFNATIIAPSPPAVTVKTAPHSIVANNAFSFALASNTFTDPQNDGLTYSALLAGGASLPSWLSFNPATETFSGTAPVTLQTLGIAVTAVDTDGLSVTETFNATVTATAPSLTLQTAAQTWVSGHAVSWSLPAGTFTDPQGETLIYTATLSNGSALPSGLVFNTATGTFSGTAPAAGLLAVKVTATDSSGLSAFETASVTIKAPAAPAVSLPAADANISLAEKAAFSLQLPSTTFTDPQGDALTYSATLANGSSLPSWLNFNAKTDTFTGTVPITPETLGVKVTATNTDGLSSSTTMNFIIKPSAPTVGAATPSEDFVDRSSVKLNIASAFSDPQGSALTFSGVEISGVNATSWLTLTSAGVLSGLVPNTGSSALGIRVTATNAYGLTATETFGLSYAPPRSTFAAGSFSNSTTASELLTLHT